MESVIQIWKATVEGTAVYCSYSNWVEYLKEKDILVSYSISYRDILEKGFSEPTDEEKSKVD